ncbi:MAG: glycine/sarcosine/betaine reductase selenoprotein B family protein [Alphaproteobacteria bacterium]|nr:glycine/sarcosine/betaine reductase selenoprotein B family protein [Alphaproteobacteria bacterium]MDP6253170.1 glycine/sarcosine/betaine reductase selenoprotein B family protein [Alphaproteobacteria bacterium]MDP7055889.1 glycine/sarcosine/betaine reductase selenoprotein B family protein [Alphaproteobacteria bacterium]MDP7229004.1 glycine/sarcosine/betaine reductase selenoprotein B family protein [Alphaproteobacteria bacterium]MDP7461200.1 glycine/sarcosine/betaine reductase selenoprotein B 
MVRLADLDEPERSHLANIPCASFDAEPWVTGPPLTERRIAMISTAALQHRDDTPFLIGTGDYRYIADDTPASDLVMAHISTNFDRSGFEQDLNVVLPLDRMHELAEAGEIGSVARFHYAFMGSTDPVQMEAAARAMAGHLKADGVDSCILLPV